MLGILMGRVAPASVAAGRPKLTALSGVPGLTPGARAPAAVAAAKPASPAPGGVLIAVGRSIGQDCTQLFSAVRFENLRVRLEGKTSAGKHRMARGMMLPSPSATPPLPLKLAPWLAALLPPPAALPPFPAKLVPCLPATVPLPPAVGCPAARPLSPAALFAPSPLPGP